MKKIILLSVILIVMGVIAFAWFSRSENANQISSLAPQINEEGGVSIEVSAKEFDFNDPKFQITFTTHEGDLNFDLTKISILLDENNKQYLPLSWDGGSGGHHLSGTLSFPSIDAQIRTVRLIIKNVYGVQERIFSWNLR